VPTPEENYKWLIKLGIFQTLRREAPPGSSPVAQNVSEYEAVPMK
jgi:hypothetical protein